MEQAQEGRVCPYCAGKGSVLEEIANVPTEHSEQTGIGAITWTRKKCPLCGGRDVF
jgi:ribosomal protein S27AE